MGALADSFYEYLPKSWLQSGKQDEQAKKMYIEAIDALLAKVSRVSKGGLLYFGQLKYDNFEHKMEHLACFSGGMIALGGKTLYAAGADANKYIKIGANITNTCHESYVRTKTRIGPETFTFSDNSDKITSLSNERYYIQRPEVIESYFYLWRITKDPKYRLVDVRRDRARLWWSFSLNLFSLFSCKPLKRLGLGRSSSDQYALPSREWLRGHQERLLGAIAKGRCAAELLFCRDPQVPLSHLLR